MDYKTPNVYVEEVSTLPPSVAGVSTAIPAFIGYTEKAIKNSQNMTMEPIRIRSLVEYVEYFGKAYASEFKISVNSDNTISLPEKLPILKYLMYYSLSMFFYNGGESCYIVSVGDYSEAPSSKKMSAGLATIEKEDEPTLLVFPDGPLLSSDDYYGLCQLSLSQCNKLKDRFSIIDVINPNQDSSVLDFRNKIGINSLKYGAAYYPYLRTSLTYYFTDDTVKVEGINIEATVTTKDKSIEDKSAPKTNKAKTTFIKLSHDDFKTKYTEIYHKIKTELNKQKVVLPPSSTIAGIYASVDRDRGVWKAPANVSIASIIGPTVKITNNEQEELNVDPTSGKSINAIRSFTGKGTLVWGSRTLAGNDNEWRYVPVRRLFNYIEESIQKATSFAVFEPNTPMTWLKIRTMIESFLTNLWKQGALAGATADQAFFVNAGLGTTMTSQDILEGRIIIEVGLAAVRPAEFIILKFSHKLQE